MLSNMNKQADAGLYGTVLEKTLFSGINCSCYFIFGFPGETEETAERTRRFIRDHEYPESEGSLSWSMFPFVLSPLSPIYEPENRKPYQLTGYMHDFQHRTMNASQARAEILKTFFALENSGPIYRSDNQEMLRSLGPRTRKRFAAVRHRLAKAALKGPLDRPDILDEFEALFPDSR